jgi:hypothetical protein
MPLVIVAVCLSCAALDTSVMMAISALTGRGDRQARERSRS